MSNKFRQNNEYFLFSIFYYFFLDKHSQNVLADFLARACVYAYARIQYILRPALRPAVASVATNENAALSDGVFICLKNYYLLERFFNSSSQILATLLAGTSS